MRDMRDMCDAGERTECTHDLRAVGSCNMVQYSSPLPDIYQNFAGSPALSNIMNIPNPNPT